LTVISEGELAAIAPEARVPSRITTVACGKFAAGVAVSCFAQEVHNHMPETTGISNANRRTIPPV
jgi:hypothetical protein